MDPIKVTVVISPGANARDTLNSLLAQTCREIEILCHPCADLPGDSRIHYLQDTMIGGDAANAGLEAARGEYILFLRGGDTFHKDMLQRLLDRAAGADVTMFFVQHGDSKPQAKTGLEALEGAED